MRCLYVYRLAESPLLAPAWASTSPASAAAAKSTPNRSSFLFTQASTIRTHSHTHTQHFPVTESSRAKK
ncbi:hypothetical protein CEP53_010141 [Fusarium sp. AF-6]|nr:hypothetical protein CEP53_010141 [Fusarium sp. AF-6]